MRIKSLVAAMRHQMGRLLLAILIATAWLDAHAQASLPPCQGATAVWNECYGEIKFSDGESYRGGFRNGKPHGKGVYTWSDGQRYQGEFLNGDFHGKGTWTWPDGRQYVGDFAYSEIVKK